MDALPRQKLREIVDRYGRQTILDDPRRCKALLLDLCGEHRREIFVLVSALEAQVPHDLVASANHVPAVVLVAQLTQRLKENLALADEAARWAVESWAEALGIAVPPPTTVVEKVTPSMNVPAQAVGRHSANPAPARNLSPPPRTQTLSGTQPRTLAMMDGPVFTSTQRVDVMSREPRLTSADWRLLGITPGSVQVQPSHAVRLRAYQLNDARLATLVQEIVRFGSIEELDLRDNRAITDVGIDYMRQLISLKGLNLSRTSITDVGLGNLYPLKDLTELDLAWCAQISDEGLARLQVFRKLRSLDLSWCKRITDEGLARLRTLSQLTTLNLEGCKQISNEGLVYLHAIPSLASLDLSHCPQITNAGVRDLQELPNLIKLYLYGCNSITRGVTLLKRRKPDLYVLR